MTATNTCGGGIDQTAIIGHAPQMRDWTPDHAAFPPELGEGVRIEAFVTVDAGADWPTRIGPRTWLMKLVHVGHDAIIGSDCELAPGVVICGYCTIGNRVKIGVNASVLPYVSVGDGARIGAGAVVTKAVPAGMTVVGNPARELVCGTSSQAQRGVSAPR